MAYQKRNFKKDQLLTADDMNAMDDQIALNEESSKKANDDIKNKLDKSAVVQEKGNSETAVMSQAAATVEFDKLSEEIGNKIENAIIQNGNSFINYSTKENTLTFPANITFIGNNYASGFAEAKTVELLNQAESSMQVVLLNKSTNDVEVFYYYTYKTVDKSKYLYICGIRLFGTSAAPALDIGVPYTIDGDLYGVYEHKDLSSPKWVRSISGMPSIVQEPDYTTTLTLPKGGAVMYADKVMVFAEEITLPMLPISSTNLSIVYVRIPDNDIWENVVTADDFIVVPHYSSSQYANQKGYKYVCNVRMEQGTAGPSTDIGIPWMWNGVLYDVVDDTLSKAGLPADAKKVGDEIQSLKNTLQNQPSTYAYNGEKIPSKVHYFDSEKIMRMTYTGMTSQDIEIFGNYLFVSFSGVKQIRVYTLDTKELLAEMPIENFKGNAMQFSKEFYEDGDVFPLLYLGGEYSKTSVVRIRNDGDVWSADVVRTISIPTPDNGYHISPALDADNNILYGYGYRLDADQNLSGKNSMILTKWDLSRLTENEDGTYTPTLIGNKTECAYIGTTQGRKYYQGNIYIGCSNTSAPHNSKLVVIDAGTGDVKTTIDMTGVTMSENEGVCYQIVDGNIYWYYSDYFNIFKLTF